MSTIKYSALNYKNVLERVEKTSIRINKISERYAELTRIMSQSFKIQKYHDDLISKLKPSIEVEQVARIEYPELFDLKYLQTLRKISSTVEILTKLQSIAEVYKTIHFLYLSITKLTHLFEYYDSIRHIDVEITKEEIESLSEEEKNEVSKVVNDIVTEPENWQQKLTNKLNAIKAKNPVIARVIIILLTFLLGFYTEKALDSIFSTTKPVKVREEPSSSSITINIVQPQQTVYVIGEVAYYYEIEYVNCETGEKQCGYVSKRTAHDSFVQADNVDGTDDNHD